MADVLIRKATTADAGEISDVLIRSIIELCAADHLGNPKLIEGWIADKSPAEVTERITSGAQMHVSLLGDRIGAVGCYNSEGLIQLLYVAPEAQGTGHSTALLQLMETEMRVAGIETARLVSSKTAQDYYLKQGWQIEGERVVCYTSDGQPMRKQLIPAQN